MVQPSARHSPRTQTAAGCRQVSKQHGERVLRAKPTMPKSAHHAYLGLASFELFHDRRNNLWDPRTGNLENVADPANTGVSEILSYKYTRRTCMSLSQRRTRKGNGLPGSTSLCVYLSTSLGGCAAEQAA